MPNCRSDVLIFQQFDFLAELSKEIEPDCQLLYPSEPEWEILLVKCSGPMLETPTAKPTGKFPVNLKDLAEFSGLVHDKILALETQQLA